MLATLATCELLHVEWSSAKRLVSRVVRIGVRCQQLLLALLRLGADIDLPFIPLTRDRIEEAGCTPLMLALNNCWLPAVLVLLKHGANPQASNSVGATPLTYALRGMDAWGRMSNLHHCRDTKPEVYEDQDGDPRVSHDELIRHLNEMKLDCISDANATSPAFATLKGKSASLLPSCRVLQQQVAVRIRGEGSTDFHNTREVVTERLRADWLARSVCELVWHCSKAALTDRRYCLQCHVWGAHAASFVQVPCRNEYRCSFLELLHIESRTFMGPYDPIYTGLRLCFFTAEDDQAATEAQRLVNEAEPSASCSSAQQASSATRCSSLLPSASLLNQFNCTSDKVSKLLSALDSKFADRLSPVPYPAQWSGVRCGLRRRILREAMVIAAFCGANLQQSPPLPNLSVQLVVGQTCQWTSSEDLSQTFCGVDTGTCARDVQLFNCMRAQFDTHTVSK